MKLFLFGILLLSLFSCKMEVKDDPIVVESPKEVIVVPPAEKPYLTVKGCTNCSADQLNFILEANIKLNQTVKTSCFAEFMLERKLIQTNNKTNQQVLDSLLGADIAIEATMYYTLKRVLGYTVEGQMKEWINSRYMMQWNRCDLASLLGHETSHKIGYDHDFYNNSKRPFSVPYSINEAIDKCCVR